MKNYEFFCWPSKYLSQALMLPLVISLSNNSCRPLRSNPTFSSIRCDSQSFSQDLAHTIDNLITWQHTCLSISLSSWALIINPTGVYRAKHFVDQRQKLLISSPPHNTDLKLHCSIVSQRVYESLNFIPCHSENMAGVLFQWSRCI